MKIEIGNVCSVARDVDLTSKSGFRQWEDLVKLCSVTFKYTGRVRSGAMSYPVERKIEKKYISYATYEFPSGWVGEISRQLGVEVVDLRTKAAELDVSVDTAVRLRDYQEEAVQRCMWATRGIIEHPTGSGKSIIIAELVRRLKVRTLIVVPKLDLLVRMHDRLSQDFPDVGIIGEGQFNPGWWVTVATPQTLWKRRDTPEVKKLLQREVDCVIFDECHHINVREVAVGYKWVKAPQDNTRGVMAVKSFDVNTWWQLAAMCQKAYYRFGFTATPGDKDSPERKMLEAMTGRVLHQVKGKELVEKGFLAAPEIHLYSVPQPRYPTWPLSVKHNIVESEKRNKLIKNLVDKELDEGRRVLVVVDRVQHGKILWKMIEDSKLVTGVVSGPVRDEVLKALRTSGCVIGTVFDEGSDVPELDTVVIAAAGKSPRRLLQRIGRVLRPAKGKTARIIDFMDEDGKDFHGKVGILWRQAYRRASIYHGLDYPVKVFRPKSKEPKFGLLRRRSE